MGLFTGDFRFLVSAKRMGLNGGSACTIGRQPLFFTEQTMDKIIKEYDQDLSALPRGQAIYLTDNVLRALGFDCVDVLDISDYEGANVLHDLNLPIPPEIQERYNLVVDGGTLEHVFDFPMAIENVMRMAKIGGDVLLISPANNYCGHGFYQLSPELFFRIFSRSNGFELLRIYMHCDGRYYHIVDPIDIHGRVELLNSKMALLMVHARKVAHVPEVLKPPQQSDYVTTWAESFANKEKGKRDGRLKAFIRARISAASVTKISKFLFHFRLKRDFWLFKWRSRLSNRKIYVPVTKWDMTTREALKH